MPSKQLAAKLQAVMPTESPIDLHSHAQVIAQEIFRARTAILEQRRGKAKENK